MLVGTRERDINPRSEPVTVFGVTKKKLVFGAAEEEDKALLDVGPGRELGTGFRFRFRFKSKFRFRFRV